LRIVLSNRSGEPLYEQIKSQIKEAIFTGELQEDELLPSIRQLAKDLKISAITTNRAYSDLEAEGFVTNVQGKGCYVLPRNKEMARENTLCKVEAGLTAAVEAAKAGGITKDEIRELLELLLTTP
jgi:GntR family transcriptional regulator